MVTAERRLRTVLKDFRLGWGVTGWSSVSYSSECSLIARTEGPESLVLGSSLSLTKFGHTGLSKLLNL